MPLICLSHKLARLNQHHGGRARNWAHLPLDPLQPFSIYNHPRHCWHLRLKRRNVFRVGIAYVIAAWLHLPNVAGFHRCFRSVFGGVGALGFVTDPRGQ